MACVSARYLTESEFLQALSLLPASGGYIMLERPDFSCLDSFKSNTDWAGWDTGRIFSERIDIRWQKSEDVFHVVMISDNADLFLPQFRLDLDNNYLERKVRWLLWGSKEQDMWIERIIPKILHYPLEAKSGSRIALSVTKYINRTSIQDEFYRFTGLEEVVGN